MEQALQYLLSYLGNTVYKIEPSTEKDIFFVELNDNTTIDEISKKIASIKDVEIINGLVLKHPFEALGLDADESNRRGKQTMIIKSNITNFFESEDTAAEIKQMRENASYGTTIPKKFDVPIWQEGLYYLKLNNLIRDGFNKTMKIKGYFQEGIRVIENTDFPLADQKTIDIPFNILFDFIDSGRFKIGNVVYENERDKNLLGNEINSIKELFKMANTEAEKAQIAIELANTEAEKAQIETSYKDHILNMEKSTEKIKQDFSDTLGGMEALGGGRTATGKNIKYKISNEQLNYLVDKLNRNEKAKYKDLLFEFSKGEAWAREKAHYNLYIYTDKGFNKLYNESISKNALKSVLRNWFELVYGGSSAGGGILSDSERFKSYASAKFSELKTALANKEITEVQFDKKTTALGHEIETKFHELLIKQGKTEEEAIRMAAKQRNDFFISQYSFAKGTNVNKPTNQYIWGHGEILDSYPSDIGGSSASVEHIIEFEGKKYIVNTNQDENEVLYANKTAIEIDNIASGQYAVGGRITEGERRAVSKKNENLKIVLQELRRKVPNFKKLSNPMATTIAQLVLDYGDDDFKIKDITIKENENQSLSLYVKGKDWRGRSFYDSWYDQQMYPQRFGSMVGEGRAEGESEKEKESKINGTKTKRSSQIIKINKKDKFWHARVISPKGAKSCAVPEWATIIASGVHEGAKVTTCIMGDKEWHVQKVMVPVKGINKSKAKSIAKQIVGKINKNN